MLRANVARTTRPCRRKSDRLDAQVLAEFLALDMIPTSYRPTPRERDHRRLVGQRDSVHVLHLSNGN